MSRIAVLILTRNNGEKKTLYRFFQSVSIKRIDIYIVSTGGLPEELKQYKTYIIDSKAFCARGISFTRGMNYGLMCMAREGVVNEYDIILLMTDQTVLDMSRFLGVVESYFNEHKLLGILAPCGSKWGERFLIGQSGIKYFWYIHNSVLAIRTKVIRDIGDNFSDCSDVLWDSSNLGGYGTEYELVAKSYANDWATAITTDVIVNENESFLLNKKDLLKEEPYDKEMKLYIEEGLLWMKRKYNFKSHWQMQAYAKNAYDAFFDYYPDLTTYRL